LIGEWVGIDYALPILSLGSLAVAVDEATTTLPVGEAFFLFLVRATQCESGMD
jgi:hypothetical protein